jgi:hypothetical protein
MRDDFRQFTRLQAGAGFCVDLRYLYLPSNSTGVI